MSSRYQNIFRNLLNEGSGEIGYDLNPNNYYWYIRFCYHDNCYKGKVSYLKANKPIDALRRFIMSPSLKLFSQNKDQQRIKKLELVKKMFENIRTSDFDPYAFYNPYFNLQIYLDI